MKKSITTIILIILSNSNLFCQNDSLKIEAEREFYKIFELYRKANCDSLISKLADSIIFINVQIDTVLKTSNVIDPNFYCSRAFKRINYNQTVKDHKKYYNIYTFTLKDLISFKGKNLMRDSTLHYLSADTKFALSFLSFKSHRFSSNDIFITGVEPKNKENPNNNLGRFGYYFFVLSKTKEGWKIKALST